MLNIYPNDDVSKQANAIYVKNAGVWKPVKEVYVKTSGIWAKAYPSTGSLVYSTPGTYSFKVPGGISSFVVTLLVSGGGGGGGSIFSGDGHGAANGGSGGVYTNQTVIVTPGDTLSIVVGAGGVGVSTGNGTQGGRGGSSGIYKSGVPLIEVTGGYGGNGVTGDNAPNNTSPANGSVGGSPNGVNGSYTASWMVNRNTPGQGYDGQGQNGTGYGNGGLGGNSAGGAAQGGTGLAGGSGYIAFQW